MSANVDRATLDFLNAFSEDERNEGQRLHGEGAVALGEGRDHDVFQDAQVGEDFRRLKHPDNTGLIDLMRLNSEKGLPVERDLYWSPKALNEIAPEMF